MFARVVVRGVVVVVGILRRVYLGVLLHFSHQLVQGEESEEDEDRGDDGLGVETEAYRDAEAAHAPGRRRRGQSDDVVPAVLRTQDGAGADEADAGDDLR